MIGTRVSHYEVLDRLGEGGMGVVWKARDTQLDRDVALKVLRADAVTDSAARARLLREARTASRLNHPHICTIYEVGESDGQVFIAMELVEGRTLSARLAAGPLPVEEVLRFGVQLADALAHAHKQGIVHRDLKSANVVITSEGRAKVLDFGLAKRLNAETGEDATTLTQADTITGAGAVAGTPAYMAPEQFRGQPADARSDIWALGVMLYEMASGVRPFQGKTGYELSSAIMNQPSPPLPPGPGGPAPVWLRSVIDRCLEKDPAMRYQSSEEVRTQLETVQSEVTLKVWLAWKYGLSRRRWLAAAAAVVAVLAVLAAFDVGGVRRRLSGVLTGPKYRSLAVLPLANLSGSSDQEYFVDGMTEALTTDLSKVGGFKVISRRAARRYKGTQKPLAEIGRELNVGAVVEGSVARENGHVRVTAQLIETATERQLWAESYEREMTSILALQGDVARAIALEVEGRLSTQEEARLTRRRSVDPAVYEAYLKGMYFLDKSTGADAQKGLAYLHEALEMNPADPLANAGAALGYISVAHSSEAREDDLKRAKAAANKALSLDQSLAEGHAALGIVEGYYEWKWEDGIRKLQRAIQINPSLAMAHFHLAWFYVLQGRMKEAIAEHQIAQELDPFLPSFSSQLGEIYRMQGRYEDALREIRKAIEVAPKATESYFWLACVQLDRGMYGEAIGSLQKAGPNWKWALGVAYARAGRNAEARQLLREMEQQKLTPWIALWRAWTHATLGDRDEAFRWLAYDNSHRWLPWIFVKCCGVDAKLIQDDPRYRELRLRMRVPQSAF